MSDRNTVVVPAQINAVGYLCWVRTMRDPTVEKIDAVQRQMYLTAKEWQARTIGQPIPLTEAEYRLPLDALRAKYPCPEEKTDAEP